MKKTITLSLLALTTFFAKAQTEKNNWLVGGALAFTSSSQSESDQPGSTKGTTFALSPNVGYFLANNFAAGASLSLTSAHSSNSSTTSTTSSTITLFTAGPFVRYYFNTSPRVKLFLHGDAQWGSEKVNFNYGGTDEGQPGIPISVYEGKAGAAFFLAPNAALEFTAGYQSMTEKDSGIKLTTGSVVVGLGFQLYFGSSKK